MMSRSEKQLWRWLALSGGLVGLVLLLGKFLPLPGIQADMFVDAILLCRDGVGPPIHGGWLFGPVCPQPMLPHREVLVSPLLGSIAIIAFLAI